MMNSLRILKKSLRDQGGNLFVFHGNDVEVLAGIIARHHISNIICNKDITPFAIERDLKIAKLCKTNKINFVHVEDYTIFPLDRSLKKDGSPYVIYSAFKKQFFSLGMPTTKVIPRRINFRNIRDTNVVKIPNGSELGINLGVHIKFGRVSVREIYIKHPELRDKLIWREFFYVLAYHRQSSFTSSLKNIKLKWNDNKTLIDSWKRGTTGFPIVDAGMRELVATGYINNRMRLIVSSFLRLTGANWKIGERFFAIHLIDYDPILNNSNWQWIYSIGTDTKPPNQRLLNPWLQSRKHDHKCEYIKKWVPEVKDMEPAIIHAPNKYSSNYYPMIDYHKYKKIDGLRYLNKHQS
jgi:deoxyribodipyrimidine photo-lyase